MDVISLTLLVLTLLNLGLVIAVFSRLGALRKDLRTPLVKKFNTDFKRKTVDIQKEDSKKDFRQSKGNNQQQLSQSRQKNNNPQQQNRPMQRRPAVKVPDVFSNEVPARATNSVPPRPIASDSAPVPSQEGRRPLPPRFSEPEPAAPLSFGSAPADLAPIAPAPVIPTVDDDEGVELDRSKMTHGRRNVVKKTIIEDDDNFTEEKSV